MKFEWTKRTRLILVGAVAVVILGVIVASSHTQFLVGGALINAGYRMQDHAHAFDFQHHDDITATQVWNEFSEQNALAASVRTRFPRSTNHPVIAMLVCMDARIDTNELAGDTRHFYYIVRTAGSVMADQEEDMLELAVANGVKVIVLTRHTDCAAEKAAKDPELRKRFPALTAAVDERDKRVEEFLKRPLIAQKVAAGQLLVKQMVIDTSNERILAAAPHTH